MKYGSSVPHLQRIWGHTFWKHFWRVVSVTARARMYVAPRTFFFLNFGKNRKCFWVNTTIAHPPSFSRSHPRYLRFLRTLSRAVVLSRGVDLANHPRRNHGEETGLLNLALNMLTRFTSQEVSRMISCVCSRPSDKDRTRNRLVHYSSV